MESSKVMSIYEITRKIVSSIVPQDLRDKFWQSNRPFNVMMLKIRHKLRTHNEIYDQQYYEGVIEEESAFTAPIISESIIREFNPQLAIDVGCGTGNLLAELNRKGVKVLGFEYSQAAIDMCRSKGLSVKKFDLESQESLNEKADLVISAEVAEHLPAKCADRFVDLLTNISDIVLITAATPGQGGIDHVNEQPNEYWIEKFLARNFQYQKELTMKLRQEWQEKQVTNWYYSNVMVFNRV